MAKTRQLQASHDSNLQSASVVHVAFFAPDVPALLVVEVSFPERPAGQPVMKANVAAKTTA